MLAATEAYRADSDPLADFIAGETIIMEGARVERGELFAAYTAWAKSIGESRPLPRNEFYDRVRKLAGVDDGRWKAGDTAVRGFTGIGLCASTTENGAF